MGLEWNGDPHVGGMSRVILEVGVPQDVDADGDANIDLSSRRWKKSPRHVQAAISWAGLSTTGCHRVASE